MISTRSIPRPTPTWGRYWSRTNHPHKSNWNYAVTAVSDTTQSNLCPTRRTTSSKSWKHEQKKPSEPTRSLTPLSRRSLPRSKKNSKPEQTTAATHCTVWRRAMLLLTGHSATNVRSYSLRIRSGRVQSRGCERRIFRRV